MLTDRNQIREGMAVYSSDGEKLGKVLTCGASSFTIEKGFFFPKDYVARFEDVTGIDGDDIRLSMTKDSFVSLREGGTQETTPSTRPSTMLGGSDDIGLTGERASTREDVRMPVREEELDVVKRDQQAGEVRLRKDVVTETRHVDVPVTREEVHVERVPVTDRNASLGERAFEKDSVSMPIHEEEVEIRKRPVVKEEVRLRKDRVTEQRAAEADVRKERVEVEGADESRIRRDEDPGSTRHLDEPGFGAPRRDDELP